MAQGHTEGMETDLVKQGGGAHNDKASIQVGDDDKPMAQTAKVFPVSCCHTLALRFQEPPSGPEGAAQPEGVPLTAPGAPHPATCACGSRVRQLVGA